jgi:hypothetical protein
LLPRFNILDVDQIQPLRGAFRPDRVDEIFATPSQPCDRNEGGQFEVNAVRRRMDLGKSDPFFSVHLSALPDEYVAGRKLADEKNYDRCDNPSGHNEHFSEAKPPTASQFVFGQSEYCLGADARNGHQGNQN